MGEHLIKVENLTLSYENMTVVKDLSFTVERSEEHTSELQSH